MKQIKLPKTQKLIKEFFKLQVEINKLRKKAEKLHTEILETSKNEGCFSNMLYEYYSDGDNNIYINFTDENAKNISDSNLALMNKILFKNKNEK